jgi:hypothetical protein
MAYEDPDMEMSHQAVHRWEITGHVSNGDFPYQLLTPGGERFGPGLTLPQAKAMREAMDQQGIEQARLFGKALLSRLTPILSDFDPAPAPIPGEENADAAPR